MIRHPQLDRDHEHIVTRQVALLKRANFLNHSALEQSDNLAAIVKIACEAVEFPSENCICFSLLNLANHFIEDRTTRPFRTLVLCECFYNNHIVLARDGVQLGKLRINREHLTIFIFGGLAAINEVFEHGHSVTNDINDCESNLMPKPHFTITKKTLQVLHGDSHRERVLHRLHAVALVLGGLSAVQTGRLFGDSSRAVAYWVNRFRERGIIGLEEEARPGRPSSLNAAQMKKVQRFMGKSQIKSKPVGAKTLSDYLSKEFEIVLTPRQCWRIIKRLES